MSDEKNLKNAQSVYASLCAMLDEQNIRYEKREDRLAVLFTFSGEDLPMKFMITVDANREIIRMLSPIPVTVAEDKRLDLAIATCQVNYKLVDGSFDFDYNEGKIYFRMTSSYKDSIISKDLFVYMVAIAGSTVEEYNDQFFMIAKGALPVKNFIKQL